MDALQRARELYEKGQIHDALERAQSAAEFAPRDAEAWWLLARISRHAGLPQASDRAFRRAAELSRRKAVPVRVTEPEFAGMVKRAQAEMSPDARRRLADTRIVLAALPDPAEIRAGVKPDAPARRVRRPEDVLTLYQVNLENRSGSAAALQAAVVKALSKA